MYKLGDYITNTSSGYIYKWSETTIIMINNNPSDYKHLRLATELEVLMYDLGIRDIDEINRVIKENKLDNVY